MALETANYIHQLVESNPSGGDDKTTADDHLRLIKAALKHTFPNIRGEVVITEAELNLLKGFVGNLDTIKTDLQTSIDANTNNISILVTNLANVANAASVNTANISTNYSTLVDVVAAINKFYFCEVAQDGTGTYLPEEWVSIRNSTGKYTITHELGTSAYDCVATVVSFYGGYCLISAFKHTDTVEVQMVDAYGNLQDNYFNLLVKVR